MIRTPRLERFLLSGRGTFVSKLRSAYLTRKRIEFLYPNRPINSFARVAALLGAFTGFAGYNYLVYKRAKLVVLDTSPTPVQADPKEVKNLIYSEQEVKEKHTIQRKVKHGTNLSDEIIPVDKIPAPFIIYSWLFGKRTVEVPVEVTGTKAVEIPEPIEILESTKIVEEIQYVGKRKPLVASEVVAALRSLGINNKTQLDKLQNALQNVQYLDQIDFYSTLKKIFKEKEVLAFERLYYFSKQKYPVEDIQLDYSEDCKDIKIDIITSQSKDTKEELNTEAIASTAIGASIFYLLGKWRRTPPTQSIHTIGKSLARISFFGFALYGICAVSYNYYLDASKPVSYTLKWNSDCLSKVSCTYNCSKKTTGPASFLSSYFIPGTIVTYFTGYLLGGLFGTIYFFIPI